MIKLKLVKQVPNYMDTDDLSCTCCTGCFFNNHPKYDCEVLRRTFRIKDCFTENSKDNKIYIDVK